MSVNAMGSALYGALAADATLGSLGCTGVYMDLAPQAATYPFLVLGLVASDDSYTFDVRSHQTAAWQVTAWDQGGSARRAGQLMDRVDQVLTDGTVTVSGYSTLMIRREGQVPTQAQRDEQTGLELRAQGARFLVVVS